jgi:hypothetical protein
MVSLMTKTLAILSSLIGTMTLAGALGGCGSENTGDPGERSKTTSSAETTEVAACVFTNFGPATIGHPATFTPPAGSSFYVPSSIQIAPPALGSLAFSLGGATVTICAYNDFGALSSCSNGYGTGVLVQADAVTLNYGNSAVRGDTATLNYIFTVAEWDGGNRTIVDRDAAHCPTI